MFRFYYEGATEVILTKEFQYIVCFGSTFNYRHNWRISQKFQYIVCFGSTKNEFYFLKMLHGFQYIVCFGSTLCVIIKLQWNF